MASTAEKMAVVAAMPRPSVPTATSAKRGLRNNNRAEKRTCRKKSGHKSLTVLMASGLPRLASSKQSAYERVRTHRGCSLMGRRVRNRTTAKWVFSTPPMVRWINVLPIRHKKLTG